MEGLRHWSRSPRRRKSESETPLPPDFGGNHRRILPNSASIVRHASRCDLSKKFRERKCRDFYIRTISSRPPELQMDSLDSTSLPFYCYHHPIPSSLSPYTIPSDRIWIGITSYRSPSPSTGLFQNIPHTDCTPTPPPLCLFYLTVGLILVQLRATGLDPVTPHPLSNIIPFQPYLGQRAFPHCHCYLDLTNCNYQSIPAYKST